MTSYNETDLPKKYFDVQKLLLKYIGLSLTPNPSKIYKMYGFCLLILLISFPIFVFSDMFNGRSDFNDFINNLLYGFGCTIATSKQILIFTKGSQLRTIMYKLENAPYLYSFKFRTSNETTWIKDCVRFTRRLSLCGATIGISTIAFGVLTTIFIRNDEGGHSLPFGTISFLTNRMDFKIVFIYECVVLFAAAIVYIIFDVIYASIVLHICVQLRILQGFIKRMDQISYAISIKNQNMENLDEERTIQPWQLKWKYLQKVIREAVLYHTTILEISKEAEDLFNIIIFTECTLASADSCFVLYHASMFPPSDFHFQRDMGIFSLGAGTLLLLSYFGNEVIVESQALSQACYETNFIGVDIRFQKSLLLMMQRSQEPIKFTVGKFATLSLITLVSSYRACYSYFMVLHNMHGS